MTQKIRTIRLIWEKGVGFELDTQLDGGDWCVASRIAKNDYFADLWPKTEELCKGYFGKVIDKIGAEMKA